MPLLGVQIMTDARSGAVPVGEVVAASWRFLFANWRQFLPAALVTSGFSTIGSLTGGPAMAALFLGLVLVVIAQLAFAASVLRKAVRSEVSGIAGLQFGADEMRLLGIALCTFLLLLPPVFIFGTIFSVVMAGRLVAAGVDPQATEIAPEVFNKVMAETIATPAGMLAVAALFAVTFYVSARLVMANAATIGERKIVFLQTWSWSKGNVLRVIGAMALTLLPILFLNVVLALLTPAQPSGGVVGVVLIVYLRSLIGMLAGVPLIALGAHLYKGLRPPNFVAR
jgi:hypothetical protein